MGHNPGLDFLLVSDCPRPDPLPANVTFVVSALAAFRQRAEAVLGTTVNLPQPYKLCDVRPMFGDIFAEELAGYDFWGHCDLDLMFGDIRAFVTDEVLSRHDKIFARGNLSLYRNTPRMNGLYRSDKGGWDWRQVLANGDNLLFDEWYGIKKIADAEGVPVFLDEVIADIDRSHHDLRLTRDKGFREQLFFWEAGKIFRARWDDGVITLEERALIHLQKRKLSIDSSSARYAERIYFTATGMVAGKADEAIGRRDLARINGRSLLGDARILVRRARAKLKR